MSAPALQPRLCVRARFSGSTCSECVHACPQGAFAIDPLPRLDEARCTGCNACVAACPVEAVRRTDASMERLVPRLGGVSAPVLACREPRTRGHARTGCLAGLDLVDLLTLATGAGTPIQLNATACTGCVNQAAMPALRRRLEILEDHGLGTWFELVEDEAGLCYEPRRVPRRGLLAALLFAGAGSVRDVQSCEIPSAPGGGKRQLQRLVRLAAVLDRLPPETARALRPVTGFRAETTSGCDACGRCAAVCPTGALLRGRRGEVRTLTFLEARCVGCAVCAEFCPSDALRICAAGPGAPVARALVAELVPSEEHSA